MKKFSALFVLVIAACSSTPPTEQDPVAQVNGLKITVRDYLNLYENIQPTGVQMNDREKAKLRNLVIQTLVRRAVILTTAEDQGISVNDEELQQGVRRLKEDYPEQTFRESLLDRMVDEVEWTEQLKQDILIEKMFEKTDKEIEEPSLEDALHYYQENVDSFKTPARVQARHIVTGGKDVAEEVLKKLQQDTNRFSELASNHSIGPEAEDDAIIEVDKGTMPEDIDEVLFTIPLNEISRVVESEYGYHIFQVISRSPETNKDFEDVKDEILKKLRSQNKSKWVRKFEEGLLQRADIKYNRDLIQNL